MKMKFDFRDVSSGLAKIREILLGRKSVNPHRFPPMLAPRSIPPPDVPRGPEYKYSDQYYGARDAMNSVKPPVVAPVAEGSTGGFGYSPARPVCSQPLNMKFPSELPTPGCVWWFDAHCYYKESAQTPCGPPTTVPSPPAPRPPCPPPEPPRGTKQSSEICDPCLPEEKKSVC